MDITLGMKDIEVNKSSKILVSGNLYSIRERMTTNI
jgi:hypothetical protein